MFFKLLRLEDFLSTFENANVLSCDQHITFDRLVVQKPMTVVRGKTITKTKYVKRQ